MNKKIALISVGMNTPLKIEEERIWSSWFKGMFGSDVYLINNISTVDNGIQYAKPDLIDYSESFPNPGHLPGCCEGLMRGINHLKNINYEGPVVFTVCDVIANEDFKKVIEIKDFDAEIYTHDWGPGYTATDWMFLTPHIWQSFQFPEKVGHVNETGAPVLRDYKGRTFVAPDGFPVLEDWNTLYIRERGWKNKYFTWQETPGWSTNIGTTIDISGHKFKIVQSGGDARPTKTHLTNKYLEFDKPYED